MPYDTIIMKMCHIENILFQAMDFLAAPKNWWSLSPLRKLKNNSSNNNDVGKKVDG